MADILLDFNHVKVAIKVVSQSFNLPFAKKVAPFWKFVIVKGRNCFVPTLAELKVEEVFLNYITRKNKLIRTFQVVWIIIELHVIRLRFYFHCFW